MERSFVLFPGALGDFICFLPTLARLAYELPVDLFARSEYRDLAPPTVVTRSMERPEISRLFAAGVDEDEEIRRFFDSYAAVYSWMGSGAPTFVENLSRLARGAAIFPFRPRDRARHITDYYLSCIRSDPSPTACPVIVPSAAATQWSARYWRDQVRAEAKVLAIAPGSGGKEKNWPAEFFGEVARWWQRAFGGHVLLVLGTAETESLAAVDWGASTLVVRDETLGNVVALLRRCDAYLGNDSGVSHLAAAVGLPSVVLFGPTDPVQWSPRGRRVVICRRFVVCSPCSEPTRKSCWHRACLSRLDPRRVIETLESVYHKSLGGAFPVLDNDRVTV